MVIAREMLATRVSSVIAEIADCYPDEVKPSHQLQPDLGMDSFERVELLNDLEDEFGIVFRHPDDRTLTQPDTTVGELVAAVTNLLAMKETPA